MSKRRKYDMKNKRSFIIILILSIVIIGIFSLFIYKYSKASKIQYVIESGSILQDVDKNYINVDDDALLKIRWNGNYYLVYNDKKVNLGKKVIVYNNVTGGMKLYGTFYSILEDGKVMEHKEETVLPNTTDCKFYKLDDREYLLVDNKIYSSDYSIETNGYLLVELDKAGNAKLSNNKINLKTITPTKLLTSKYTFDIANEILNYGKYDIDLKKIIGSTNQYVPDDGGSNKDNDKDNNKVDNNQPNVNLGTGIGTGQVGKPGDVINKEDNGNTADIEDVMDKIKMTSILRVVEGLTQIDIDYVIYDPYNEYQSVYVEVISPGKMDIIHLSKLDTHLTIENLFANSEYRLNFVYTMLETDSETNETKNVPYTFESFDLKTKMPEYDISIYKISRIYNTLTYNVNLQKNFKISSLDVNLSFSYDETILNGETSEVVTKYVSLDDTVDMNNVTTNYIRGKFDISQYSISPDTEIKLTVKSVVANGVLLPVNSTYTFRFGR